MDKEKHVPLIFIIDDNEVHIRLMRDLLQTHGMMIIACNNPREAISLIQKSKPDLILMDISLKEMSGLKLMQIIKKTPSIASIPVVALTAYATQKDRENAISAGSVGFMTKPIDTRLFPQKIADFLNNSTQ
jgi:two-component system cell cycle response regulator DivK